MNGYKSAYPHGYDASDSKGLTKRELFAAMAMQGLLARQDACEPNIVHCVACADALLKELEK